MNRFIFCIFLSSIVFKGLSQGNLTYVDQKPFHFGFSLGFNTMDFGVTASRDSIASNVYDARVSTLSPGFSVGIITDLRINRYLNLRFNPTLQFGARELSYSINGISTKSLTIQSIPVCMPIYLKYSAERKNNYRPYLIWGGGAYIDLGTDTNKPVLLKPIDFYTEFGVGCDLYFSFFKLCPEIKYSIGFNDMFVPLSQRNAGSLNADNQLFSKALSKLTSRMLTLTFNFE